METINPPPQQFRILSYLTMLQESTRAIVQLNLAAQGLHDEIARFNGQA